MKRAEDDTVRTVEGSSRLTRMRITATFYDMSDGMFYNGIVYVEDVHDVRSSRPRHSVKHFANELATEV